MEAQRLEATQAHASLEQSLRGSEAALESLSSSLNTETGELRRQLAEERQQRIRLETRLGRHDAVVEGLETQLTEAGESPPPLPCEVRLS